VTTFRANRYVPTAARAGDSNTLFRLQNMFVRGGGNDAYLEVTNGPENLSESIAVSVLTGTLAITSGSKTVTGTGTAFLTELHLGQRVIFHDNTTPTSYLLVVDEITDNTHFIAAKAPAGSASGKTAYRMPRLFELNKKRGTLIWGKAIEFDKGTILAVGDGTLRRNGSVLPGSSLSLTTRKPKLAIYDSATGNFSIYALGMTTPVAPTITSVTGGTKGMKAGDYGIVIAPAKVATGGYNNGTIPVVGTLVAGQRFEVTPGAFDTAHGNDAWNVFGTLYNNGNIPPTNGPWFFVQQITSADISAGVFHVEWLDAELTGQAELLSFDNDAPQDAEFVATLSGVPVYISCQGPGSTSPGPVIISAKPNNPEAAPLEQAVPLSPPETIVGCVSALGRLYLMTPNTLQIAQSIPTAPYVLTRPFWKTGFKNPDALIFINGTLYGFPLSGPTRSIADGDEGSEETRFAADVEEITRDWIPAHVLVAHDPKNNAVCFFHIGDSVNSNGYLTTRCLVYGLKQNAWIADLVLDAVTTDYIVCGAASINGNLELLLGGRNIFGTVTCSTYRFDTGSGASVAWYAAWAFTDSGEESRDKVIKNPRVTGKLTSSSIGIHGAGASESIPVTTLEAGNSGSLTGAVALTNTSSVSLSQRVPLKARAAIWTTRIDGTWAGGNVKDRVDEIVVDVDVIGARR
jgi:hypothetical protein